MYQYRMYRLYPKKVNSNQGFSLIELMSILFIIGVLISMSRYYTLADLQRERINTVALGLVGWLEEIRSNSYGLNNSTAGSSGGCTVTFSANANALPGSTIATVSNVGGLSNTCSKLSTFSVPSIAAGGSRFIISKTGNNVTFTPRGSKTDATTTTVSIFMQGSDQLRCVQISSLLGIIRIGSKVPAISTETTCTSYVNY